MNQNIKSVLARIRYLEESIQKGHEYLEYNMHADWNGFRALFTEKFRDGKALPPHKDWVKNVFIPRHEKTLKRAQDRLEKLEGKDKDKSTGQGLRHHN
ncbi:MAG: hypothetical protein KC900_01590 [Candidatus Omnitrophica bacterium]|nr:hypothetical protein [Candidatus Omnitrophota bacterium]